MAIINWKSSTKIDAEIYKSDIVNLKKELTKTDYQIIKSSEYQLLGLELPYDITELHISRQTIRDEINRLEKLVETGKLNENEEGD